jgi:DUF4097 and DUF4098 domain-containing protein YvlB
MKNRYLRISAWLAFSLLLLTSVSAAVTEHFKQNYPLNPNGSIHIENVNGDIEIVAWDKPEVALEAEKRAPDDERLKLITLEIDARADQLSIKTKYAKSGWFGSNYSNTSVRYKLMVPAGVRLNKIDTVNADISVVGVRGPVDLDTVNGRITATGLAHDTRLDSVNGSLSASFDSVADATSIKLDSVNGRATLTLPAGASARIHADTVNGSIKIDQAIKLSKSGKREIKGEIGSGGPSVVLDTVNGSISIKEAAKS